MSNSSTTKESFFESQVIPISLTFVVCGLLTLFLWVEVLVINNFTRTPIHLEIRWWDVAIGLTIYLKTAVDFAIYMGHLMGKHPGWKNRVAIEIGTALGNGAGTMAILVVWAFFKEVRWLLALMVTVASFVLLRLAEDSLEHATSEEGAKQSWVGSIGKKLESFLRPVNRLFLPIVKYILPDLKMKDNANGTIMAVFSLAFSVPFILGLDDFAGYVTLFNIVNVFGFAIGVFLGHMVLNIFLYLSPRRTIRAVKNPVIALLGALAFIGIAIWGLIEVTHLIGW